MVCIRRERRLIKVWCVNVEFLRVMDAGRRRFGRLRSAWLGVGFLRDRVSD
jgi:hypothetical protein